MKVKKNYSFILWIAVIFPIVIHGLFFCLTSDDFDVFIHFQKFGLLKGVLQHYISWGGRIGVWFILGLVHAYRDLYILWGLFFGASLVLLVNILPSLLPWRVNKNSILLEKTVLMVIFWVILRPFVGQCVYWLSGAPDYVVPILLGLILIIFEEKMRESKRPSVLFLFFIYSFFVSVMFEQLCCVLLAYFCIKSFYIFRVQKNGVFYKKLTTMVTLSVFLGAIVILLAPGNYVRIEAFGVPVYYDFPTFFENSLMVLKRFFESVILKMIVSFLGGVLYCIVFIDKIEITNKISFWKWPFLLVILSFASMFPFLFASVKAISIRSFFLPIIILGFMSFGVSYFFVQLLKKQLLKYRLNIFLRPLFFLFIISVIFLEFYDLSKAYGFWKIYKDRERQIIKMSKEFKDVEIAPVKSSPPKTIFFSDFSDTTDDGINPSAAKFYGVNSIKTM